MSMIQPISPRLGSCLRRGTRRRRGALVSATAHSHEIFVWMAQCLWAIMRAGLYEPTAELSARAEFGDDLTAHADDGALRLGTRAARTAPGSDRAARDQVPGAGLDPFHRSRRTQRGGIKTQCSGASPGFPLERAADVGRHDTQSLRDRGRTSGRPVGEAVRHLGGDVDWRGVVRLAPSGLGITAIAQFFIGTDREALILDPGASRPRRRFRRTSPGLRSPIAAARFPSRALRTGAACRREGGLGVGDWRAGRRTRRSPYRAALAAAARFLGYHKLRWHRRRIAFSFRRAADASYCALTSTRPCRGQAEIDGGEDATPPDVRPSASTRATR